MEERLDRDPNRTAGSISPRARIDRVADAVADTEEHSVASTRRDVVDRQVGVVGLPRIDGTEQVPLFPIPFRTAIPCGLPARPKIKQQHAEPTFNQVSTQLQGPDLRGISVILRALV